MKIKVIVTNNLDTLRDLTHSGYYKGEPVLPQEYIALSGTASSAKRRSGAAAWLADLQVESVVLCYHSSVLATIGSGFISNVITDVGNQPRERAISRYPSVKKHDLQSLVGNTFHLTGHDTVELWHVTDNLEDVQVISNNDQYVIDPSVFTSPNTLAAFIGAIKYMQSTNVIADVVWLRHEYVDIAGRLWMYNTRRTRDVHSEEIDFAPDDWGTRIIYTAEELLNDHC